MNESTSSGIVRKRKLPGKGKRIGKAPKKRKKESEVSAKNVH
jgi:hypothetical protein